MEAVLAILVILLVLTVTLLFGYINALNDKIDAVHGFAEVVNSKVDDVAEAVALDRSRR